MTRNERRTREAAWGCHNAMGFGEFQFTKSGGMMKTATTKRDGEGRRGQERRRRGRVSFCGKLGRVE